MVGDGPQWLKIAAPLPVRAAGARKKRRDESRTP